MGDAFFSTKPKNLGVFIFYYNLQLIHSFLTNWPASLHLRNPTNFEENIL
jgi:hypothetical protein